jgi:predicted RNA-binding protein with RPS1 domain
MAGPAGIRRRLPVSRLNIQPAPSIGPPEPKRCPYCGFDVLDLAVHVAEAHPEHAQEETAAEREAREQEAARQARVAAEIARREAEAAQRKAEARARRQAIEGLESPAVPPAPAEAGVPSSQPKPHHVPLPSPGVPAPSASPAAPAPPQRPDGGPTGPAGGQPSGTGEAPGAAEQRPRPAEETWGRLRRAQAARTILSGVVRSRKPFGVFVDVGGIDGLVRNREVFSRDDPAALQVGRRVQVVVLALDEDARRVELSMRRAGGSPAAPATGAPGAAARVTEGPMAMAFRLAQERKGQGK